MPAISNEALKFVQTPTDLGKVNNLLDPANSNPFPGGKGNPNTYPTLENELKWTKNKANLNPGASGTSVRYGNARPAGKAPPLSGVGSGNGFTSPMIEQGLKQTPAPTNPLPSSPATRPSTINQAVKNLPSLPTDLDSGLTKSGPIWQPARNAAGEAAKGAAKGASTLRNAGGVALKGASKVGGAIGGIIIEEALFPRPTQDVEETEYFKELNRLVEASGKVPSQMTPSERERISLEAQRKTRKDATDNPLYSPEEGIKAIDDVLKNLNPKPTAPKAPTKDNLKAPGMTPEREQNLKNMERFRKQLEKQPKYDPNTAPGIPLLTPDGKPFDPLNPPKPKTGSPLNPSPYNPSNPYNPPTPANPPRPRPIAPPAPFDPTPTPNPPLTTPNDPFKPIAPPVPQDDKKLTPTPTDKPKIENPPVNNPGFGGVNLNWPISENLLSMKLDLSQIGEKQVQPRLDILQKKLSDDYQIKLDDQTGKLTKEIEKSTEKIITNQGDQTSKIITALSAIPALVGTALAPKFGEIISTLMPKFTELDNSINTNINKLPGKIITPVNNNTNTVGANLMNNTTSQSQVIQQQLHDTQANNLTALTTMTGQCNPACGSGSGNKNPNSKETIKKVKFPNPTKDYNRPNPKNKWAVNAKPDMQELELKTDLDKMNYLIDAVNRLDQLFPIKEIVGGKFDKDLMAPTGLTGDRNIPIYNYFQLIEYMFRAWDKRIGAPAPIKIKDSDPLTPGSQPLTVKPANLFEASNLIYKTSFDASRDIDLTNALATRTMLMTANCYKVVAQMYGYLEAILSDLGMETTEELLQLNLPCDPYAGKGEFAGDGKGFEFKVDSKFDSNKEQDIEDLAASMLKPSKVPVKFIKKSDVTTLRHIVEGVGRFAATAAAANALPLNDIDKILKHRVKQEQLETALQIRRGQLANGIGPIEKKQDK